MAKTNSKRSLAIGKRNVSGAFINIVYEETHVDVRMCEQVSAACLTHLLSLGSRQPSARAREAKERQWTCLEDALVGERQPWCKSRFLRYTTYPRLTATTIIDS